jgi:hypothetical protein
VGSSHNRLTSAEDNEEALLSGYPPVGLLDAKRIEQTEEKRKQPYIPSLNAEALRLGRVRPPLWHAATAKILNGLEEWKIRGLRAWKKSCHMLVLFSVTEHTPFILKGV